MQCSSSGLDNVHPIKSWKILAALPTLLQIWNNKIYFPRYIFFSSYSKNDIAEMYSSKIIFLNIIAIWKYWLSTSEYKIKLNVRFCLASHFKISPKMCVNAHTPGLDSGLDKMVKNWRWFESHCVLWEQTLNKDLNSESRSVALGSCWS